MFIFNYQYLKKISVFPVYVCYSRLLDAINGKSRDSIKDRFASEALLLRTYDAKLPKKPSVLPPGIPDDNASYLLDKLDPTILKDFTPMTVQGDGNCLFRNVCQKLYCGLWF